MNHEFIPIGGRALDYDTLKWRMGQSFDHVAKFSSHLVRRAKSQVGDTREIDRVNALFQNRLLDLQKSAFSQLRTLGANRTLTPKELKRATVIIKKVADGETELLKELQLDILVDLSHFNHPDEPWFEKLFEWQVRKMATGGRLTRFVVRLTSSRSTLKAYREARAVLSIPSRKYFSEIAPLTLVEEDIKRAFESDPVAEIARRSGVVGMRGIYFIQDVYSKKRIKEQLKSFRAHRFSEWNRTQLKQTVGKVKLELTPLNKTFDDEIEYVAYGPIVGQGGISSMNRMEPHLINAYRMQLSDEKGVFFEGFRHAILAEKHSASPERRLSTSRQMTQELLMAPVLTDYHERGIAPKQRGEGPEVHVVSISLVTPDVVRPALNALGIHQMDERRMLHDQIQALKSFDECTSLPVSSDTTIRTNLRVSAFNFGTNLLAVDYGRIVGASQTQFTINNLALKELNTMVNDFIDRCDQIGPNLQGLGVDDAAEANDKYGTFLNQKRKAVKTVRILHCEIKALMQNPSVYLAAGNQYETQGRMILLMQTMDNLMKPLKKDPLYKNIPGYKWMFNCMSDKDRSGIMAAVACALSNLYHEESEYPSLLRLFEEPDLAKRYVELILEYLRSKNLDITTINTGAPGYKVGQEANVIHKLRKTLKIPKDHPIWGIDPRFPELQGLSSLTNA